MKKIFLIISLIVPLFAAAATTASSVVEKTVETIRKAPSISANITIETEGHPATGTIILSGDRFMIDSQVGSRWFDGKTLWAYSPQTNEVTVTEPTDEELAEINPFQFLKSARNDFTPRLLKSAAGAYTVELKPKKGNSGITSAVVTVDSSTYLIKSIKLTVNKQVINIRLSSVRTGKALPDSIFRFEKRMLPKAEINDLR
ncbi:MAG: outer-membrane lipoprotein carrier protein LolA [Muribaculaceae bacterium]|nr:outer-membrane lipoprotein carrier protein LolA [Muribaculaceae bacterium]